MNIRSVQYSPRPSNQSWGPVYLDQLAKPGAPLSHRMCAYRTAFSDAPIARLDHHLACTLYGKLNVVQFAELFVSQRRPKVPAVCADEPNGRGTNGFIQPPVRGSASLLADQSSQTFLYIALCQSPDLTGADTHLLRCLLLISLAFPQQIQYLYTFYFLLTHQFVYLQYIRHSFNSGEFNQLKFRSSKTP